MNLEDKILLVGFELYQIIFVFTFFYLTATVHSLIIIIIDLVVLFIIIKVYLAQLDLLKC